MLNEIIIYGNPIVYNNVGYPPLLKQYLIDRLGINIHRIRPIKPLKTPILVPQREHRLVDSNVPKVPKMPVEMKMLTYYQDPNQSSNSSSNRNDNPTNSNTNSRSNLSSAESVNINLKKKRTTSEDSFDTGGHYLKNDHVYKPFKNDTKLKEGMLSFFFV